MEDAEERKIGWLYMKEVEKSHTYHISAPPEICRASIGLQKLLPNNWNLCYAQ